MVGEEEEEGYEDRGEKPVLGNRRMFWRSASWSASRTGTAQPSSDCAEQDKSNGGQFRRFPPLPLTPRSQQNSKIRACLPPLQPLSIARRSLDEWPKAGSDDVGEWPLPATPSGGRPGEGLKLDVSLLQKSSDPAGSFVNKERIAFFDKECSKVADHVYLGGDAVARNRDILRQNGITHVLNCVGFVCPEYFKSDLVYKTLWLQDSPSEDITSILYDVFDYFEDVREQGGRVLVHCCQGVSRSTSLVIAYLMWREGQSFDDAFQYVKAARRIANPNMGFACQLLQCQKRVHAIPLSPSSLLRMYRMAPHSPYDPLHLVPKMLNDPSPSALDSRGAFIVHVPSAIYVWVGKSCEPVMERDAKGAAFQVVRYERVQGPILTIEEGEEPSEFWDALFNLTIAVDKSCKGVQVGKVQNKSVLTTGPSSRKVDLYDVDFELFRKAITGGVVPPFSSSEAGQENHLPARESNWSVLRRKFAPGNKKEIVSAPKNSLCRIYSDSMLLVDSDNCVNKNLLQLAPSPYLSPSSLSSDSSTSSKFTESPSLSPTTSCSSTPSPASSTLSNSSPSCKKSNHPLLNKLGTLGVTSAAKFCSQAVISPSKRFAISIAERRGSLSPSLKLPILNNEDSRSSRKVKNVSSTSLASGLDDFSNTNNFCSLERLNIKDELPDPEEDNIWKEGDVRRADHLLMSSQRSDSESSACNVVSLGGTLDELGNNYPFQETRQASVPIKLMDGSLCVPNGSQPLVRRWPSLEKIVAFSAGDLESDSAFLFSYPSASVDKPKYGTPYLWIGKSFKHNSSPSSIDGKKDIGGVQADDLNKICCDNFTSRGPPKDILVKVVKEGEEPMDFLEMFNSLL